MVCVCGDGLLRKWLELIEVLRVGPWPEGMSILITPESSLSFPALPCGKATGTHSKGAALCKSKRVLTRNHAGILRSDFQPSEWGKNKFVLFNSQPMVFLSSSASWGTHLSTFTRWFRRPLWPQLCINALGDPWRLGRWVHEPTAEISDSGQVFSHCGCPILPQPWGLPASTWARTPLHSDTIQLDSRVLHELTSFFPVPQRPLFFPFKLFTWPLSYFFFFFLNQFGGTWHGNSILNINYTAHPSIAMNLTGVRTAPRDKCWCGGAGLVLPHTGPPLSTLHLPEKFRVWPYAADLLDMLPSLWPCCQRKIVTCHLLLQGLGHWPLQSTHPPRGSGQRSGMRL